MNKTRHTDFLLQRTVTPLDMMGRVDQRQKWTGSAWSTIADFDYTAKGQRWKMKDPITTSIAAGKYVEYQYTSMRNYRHRISTFDIRVITAKRTRIPTDAIQPV